MKTIYKIIILMVIVAITIAIISIIPSAEAEDTTLEILVPETNFYVGDTFTVYMNCSPAQPIKAYEFSISFNQFILNAVEVVEGDLFEGYTTFFNDGNIDNEEGDINYIYDVIVGNYNTSEEGSCVLITFEAIEVGYASIVFSGNIGVANETQYVSIDITDNHVVIYSHYDVNGDGYIDINDLVALSNHYLETGDNCWITEDVDCNGIINILDFVIIANQIW